MKKILYTLMLASIFSVGCTDLTEEVFDKIPESQYPENDEQVAGLAVDAYAQLRPLCDDEGWWFLAQEVSSDELVFPTRDTDWDDGGKWRVMHQHEWGDDVEGVNNMWSKMWSGVTRCNQIIDQMGLLPDSPTIQAKINEVETMRAFYYYLLMDNYGDIPYLTSATGVPDLPLKIKRAAVFDSLTTELEKNLSSLKAIDNKYMATRYMAFSLLAKIYMNSEVYTGTQQYAKADAYIDSVLSGPYNLEGSVLAPFITDNQGSSEIIFSIPYDEDDFQGFRIHMRTLHYQSNLTFDMNVGPWNGCAVVKDHMDTYEASDSRLAYFLYGPQNDSKGQPITWEPTEGNKIQLDLNPEIPLLRMTAENTPEEIKASGARVVKYEIKKGAKQDLSNDFPLFRLTDFQLMKAEVILRGVGTGDADALINEIRIRAGVDPWTGATLDQLLAERGREMFLEGHRRQDLIRFGEFTKVWWAKGDSQGGKAGDASVETFPIPKWAKDANSNLDLPPQ